MQDQETKPLLQHSPTCFDRLGSCLASVRALAIELNKSLPGSDNASLVQNIREILTFIDTLPSNVQATVRSCYASSVRDALLMSFGIALVFLCDPIL
jgi:hypothetical protein